MGRYLVQTFIDDYFNEAVLTVVYEVLKIVEDSDYGTIAIVKNNTDEGWKIECFFLNEALEVGYKYSDDEKYKDWVNL